MGRDNGTQNYHNCDLRARCSLSLTLSRGERGLSLTLSRRLDDVVHGKNLLIHRMQPNPIAFGINHNRTVSIRTNLMNVL